MRIQETNQVLNEARILRNDHERHLAESGTWQNRVGGWSRSAVTFLKRPEVLAGIGTLAGVIGALVGMRKRRRTISARKS